MSGRETLGGGRWLCRLAGYFVLMLVLATAAGAGSPAIAQEEEKVPIADARVSERYPKRAYGTARRLIVGGINGFETYLRFDLKDQGSNFEKATLHVYKASRVPAGVEIRQATDKEWTDRTVVYQTRPEIVSEGRVQADFGKAGWYEIDVTELVQEGVANTLAVTSSGDDPLYLFSREYAGREPFLVLQLSDASAGPPDESDPPDPEPADDAPSLRWAPPELTEPTTIELGTGETQTNLDPGKDYIIKLPNEKKVGATVLVGGRNVVIQGGHITVEPGRASDTFRRAIYIKNATGTVHIEGVLIDDSGGGEFDGIAINAPEAIVQIQNVRVTGVTGTFEGFHGDIVQPWGGVKELRIDRLTGTTDYQGLQLEESLGDIGKALLSNINLEHTPGGPNENKTTFLLWMTTGTTCENKYPVELENVYVQPRDGWEANEVVWPPARDELECGAEQQGPEVWWPNMPVTGRVFEGRRAEGDYVPEGLAGAGYAQRMYGQP